VGLFGELLMFVFNICNMLDRSQQAFLRLDEELCNAENVCSIITFNCQWDRCPTAVKEILHSVFLSFSAFLLCILVLLKALSDGKDMVGSFVVY